MSSPSYVERQIVAKGFHTMEDVFSWTYVLKNSLVQILAPLEL
jgi:hypothetical protein